MVDFDESVRDLLNVNFVCFELRGLCICLKLNEIEKGAEIDVCNVDFLQFLFLLFSLDKLKTQLQLL